MSGSLATKVTLRKGVVCRKGHGRGGGGWEVWRRQQWADKEVGRGRNPTEGMEVGKSLGASRNIGTVRVFRVQPENCIQVSDNGSAMAIGFKSV